MTVENTNGNANLEDADLGARKKFNSRSRSLEIGKPAEDLLCELNASATSVAHGQIKARELTYRFVAQLADGALKMASEEDILSGVRKAAISVLGTKALDEEVFVDGNIYLPFVRLSDGEWVQETDKRAKSSRHVWVPNRSSEKYAGVCRFAVDHDISGEKMLRHFSSGEDFLVRDPNNRANKVTVKATINAIIAFDRNTHSTGDREILSKGDWIEILQLKPIVSVNFTKRLEAALTLSEGGLSTILVKVNGNQLEILGDAGVKAGNPTLRMFKKQRGKIAGGHGRLMTLSEDPVELSEEYRKEVA